jgi:hypothetical protein
MSASGYFLVGFVVLSVIPGVSAAPSLPVPLQLITCAFVQLGGSPAPVVTHSAAGNICTSHGENRLPVHEVIVLNIIRLSKLISIESGRNWETESRTAVKLDSNKMKKQSENKATNEGNNTDQTTHKKSGSSERNRCASSEQAVGQ